MYSPEKNPLPNASGANRARRSLTTGPLTAPSDTTMRELWIRLSSIYLHKWSSACAETFIESGAIGRTWQAGLSGVTPQQVADGLRGCLSRTDPWPPTLPEFLELCRPPPEDHSQDWKDSKPDPRKMPSPERLAWHKANIAWIQAGNELPVPGLVEPRAPAGVRSFHEIYQGKTGAPS